MRYALRFITMMLCLHLLAGLLSAGEIHEAATEGNLEQVKNLLSADNSFLNTVDDRGRTPLHHAAGNNHLDIIRYLLDSGANIEAADSRGNTPLLSAIWGNHLSAVKLLAERGANLKAEHQSYGKAIEIAYWQECIKDKSGITEYLIASGEPFDPNDESAVATRLNLASTFGNYDMAKFAVELGADVNKVCTPDGMTEVHFAASCGNADIVKLLIDNGADIHITDNEGNPPLLPAIENGHTEVVRILLNNKASTDFTEKHTGRTLLHKAALTGNSKIVEMLLSSGMKVDERDKNGKTALYYAAKYGHKSVADLLLLHGAIKPEDLQENYGRSVYLDRRIAEGGAVVWSLNNYGWAVKTSNHFLLIDNIDPHGDKPSQPSLANGSVTVDEIGDENIYVIYSTYHWPDETENIHRLEDSLKNVTYIHNRNEPWRGCKNTVYIEPYENRDFGDLKLYSVQGTHYNPSLAYLLEIDGLHIYYHNYGIDDPEQYRVELDSLQKHTDDVDIAFLPLPEPGQEEASGLKSILENIHPKAIFFHDYNRRSHLLPEVAAKLKAWGYDIPVHCAENPGDHFLFGLGDYIK